VRIEVRDTGDQNVDLPDQPLESNGADEIQEEMFAEIYQKATEVSLIFIQIIFV